MLLSVCIPTYNRAVDLKACLHSVCAAVEFLDDECEVLVSDNASPDATSTLLENFHPLNRKIKLKISTNKENIGAIRNIHLLAHRAEGDYIFYLTDDDILLPNALGAVRAAIKEYAPSFIKTAVTTYSEKSKSCAYYGHPENLLSYPDRQNFLIVAQYSHVLSGCIVRNTPALTTILDKSINAYPSIRMCALNADRAMSLAEPLIFHKWENPIFWEMDVDMSSDAARRSFTDRDCQLAFLDTPSGFLPAPVVQQLYQRWLGPERMERIEPELIAYFGSLEVNKPDVPQGAPAKLALTEDAVPADVVLCETAKRSLVQRLAATLRSRSRQIR